MTMSFQMMSFSQVLVVDACEAIKHQVVVLHTLTLVQLASVSSRSFLSGVSALFIAISCLFSIASAAEFVAFRTTNIESEIELSYSLSDTSTSNAGVKTFQDNRWGR